VGVEAALWRGDSGPDEAAGRERGLVARILHDGREFVARREGSLCAAARAGADLSRGLHCELVSAMPDGDQRPGGGPRGTAGKALGDSVSGAWGRWKA